MNANKDMNEWRAERLGYVYFSRLADLIIEESNTNRLFDYLIDIGDDNRPSGRIFAVEVKSTNADPQNFLHTWAQEYKNLAFPALLVVFDNNTDQGYYQWIKKPEMNGKLRFDEMPKKADLNTQSLETIVKEIKNWYALKHTA